MAAASALLAGACTLAPGPAPELEKTSEANRLQRESLAFVFRAGAPMPPPPAPAELAAVPEIVAAADPEEAALLRELFGDAPDLWVYASRDSDGDGVQDFRVSDYHGKFMEGDVDLDGDGVRNVLDAAPYDPSRGGRDEDGDGLPDPGSFEDENGNGVPDVVDWALEDGRAEAAAHQRELLLGYGLLLVDRSARTSEGLARAVHDVRTRVLHAVPPERLPALRVIAAEEECLLVPEVDAETNAMMISHTQTLAVYRSGIDLSGLAQLGLLLHEMAHGYQFSVDFEDLAVESRRVHFPAPVFLARMARFGWSAEPLPSEERAQPFALFAPHYLTSEPSYAWRDEPPEAWAEWLDALYAEVGEAYLEDPRVTELDIVGDYSLQNPFEWHSDSLLAYLFVEIEDWMRRHPGAVRAGGQDVRRAACEAWPSFRYANLAPEVRAHFRRTLPLRDEDLAWFAKQYVEPLARAR